MLGGRLQARADRPITVVMRARSAAAAALALFVTALAPLPALAGERARTRPVGSPPLSDARAAARVAPSAPEIRLDNADENRRVPTRRELATFRRRSTMTYAARVTGAYRGTTDEIIQWAAWKHGVNENVLRAVAVRESWWRMSTIGDDGDSFGLFQMRRPFHCCPGLARRSTAFNADYYGAILRAFYDGRETWLNTVERGAEYRAGDLWGSVGTWYAGRWRTPDALRYAREVRARAPADVAACRLRR